MSFEPSPKRPQEKYKERSMLDCIKHHSWKCCTDSGKDLCSGGSYKAHLVGPVKSRNCYGRL